MIPNVYMVSNNYKGCCYVRLMLPAFHNGFNSDRQSVGGELDDYQKVMNDMSYADVVVFHRPEEESYYNLAKILKLQGKKIVIDGDDTFKMSYHPLAVFTPDAVEVNLKKRADRIDKFLKIADMATVTTETLKKEYSKINDNVVILPNCVDPFDWKEPLKNETDKVRIGLVGSVSMEYDYEHIKPLIRKLDKRDDVQLFMFGLGDKKHRKENPKVTKMFKNDYDFWDSLDIEHFGWCDISDYPTKLNEARLDIMLIPRKDNYFNRCKSNIKFLEASMCEIACIMQSFDNGPYEEVPSDCGILIRNNKDWEREVDRLIKDKKLRQQMAKNAKKYVLENFNIEDKAYLWEEAYKSLFK